MGSPPLPLSRVHMYVPAQWLCTEKVTKDLVSQSHDRADGGGKPPSGGGTVGAVLALKPGESFTGLKEGPAGMHCAQPDPQDRAFKQFYL